MLNKFTKFLLPLTILASPLFFWTLTPNFFIPPKHTFFIFITTILFIGYSIDIIRHKSISLPSSILTLPLLGLITAVVLNLIFVPEGRPEAIASKGALIIVLSLFSLLVLSSHKSSYSKIASSAIMLSSVLLAIHSLLQLTYLHTLSFLPDYMQLRSFTPTGSFLTTLILILSGGVTAIFSLNYVSSRLRPLYLGVTILTAVTSIAIVSLMLPGSPLALNLIPYQETWSITLDALKSTRSLFVGIGLANYSLLYTAVKPLSLNLTNSWNILPQTGTSEILTILATAGFIGFIALVSLTLSGIKLGHHSTKEPLFPAFIIISLALILTPATPALYFLFFVVLSLLGSESHTSQALSGRSSLVLGIFILIVSFVLAGLTIKPQISDYYLRQAQIALTNNDGKKVYESHIQAIKWSPSLTLPHLSYAETNLSLASALSQKKDLTDADRSTISTLIQQAISEGKTAINLRPNYSLTWITLAKVYRNLINVATGADKFATDYYARAVALDPGNPALRVEYGGLFYQLGQSAKQETDQLSYYNRAIKEFQTAIQLRPTYANAYYNLAKVLESGKDYPNSYLAMQKVVANLDPNGTEYMTATKELEILKTKLPKASPSPSPVSTETSEESTLSKPSPLPSPLPGGPINLPNDTPTP